MEIQTLHYVIKKKQFNIEAQKSVPTTNERTIISENKYFLSTIRKCFYFVDFTTLKILGQKFVKFLVGILVQTMTPKGHFEIN